MTILQRKIISIGVLWQESIKLRSIEKIIESTTEYVLKKYGKSPIRVHVSVGTEIKNLKTVIPVRQDKGIYSDNLFLFIIEDNNNGK